jgi:leucyl/phenylalanyl-tRNA--protein transferase
VADPFAALDVAAAPRSLVALGGTLDAETLVSAYRAGCFPWPSSGEHEQALERQARRLVRRGLVPLLPGKDGLVPWCSPDPRAVLLADQVVVRRSLRQRLRTCGWTATVDAAFADVVAGCADRGEGTWITGRMQEAYGELHRNGGAHSVEVWAGDRLVGGCTACSSARCSAGSRCSTASGTPRRSRLSSLAPGCWRAASA